MIRIKLRRSVALTGLLLLSLTSFAQMPGGGAPAGMNAALIKLFGTNTAFSSQAKVQVLDPAKHETMSAPMTFALLNNKLRVEIDMTQMKAKDVPATAAAALKQIGMARIVSLIRPDRKLIYIIYPEKASYCTMPLEKEDADAFARNPRIQKTPLAKETVDGHACTKNKVVLSDERRQILEATTWNAADLKGFPVRIQTTENRNTSIIDFTQVRLALPDAKLFEPPAGYTQYKDTQAIMEAMMKQILSGGGKK